MWLIFWWGHQTLEDNFTFYNLDFLEVAKVQEIARRLDENLVFFKKKKKINQIKLNKRGSTRDCSDQIKLNHVRLNRGLWRSIQFHN